MDVYKDGTLVSSTIHVRFPPCVLWRVVLVDTCTGVIHPILLSAGFERAQNRRSGYIC
jgi:hypothetical protein